METVSLTIGELSRRTGCKVPTIRYYEKIGLLPNPPRTEGQQRRYGLSHLERLRFIRHGRELGFSIESIRQLLQLSLLQLSRGEPAQSEPGHHDHSADRIAKQHLAEIEDKIARLSRLRDELKAMISACESGQAHSCQVIEVLSNHQLCRFDHR